MKYKVNELEGALLDAAVAMADGWDFDNCGTWHHQDGRVLRFMNGVPAFVARGIVAAPIQPSTNWNDAGPLIERWCIKLERWHDFPEDETDATPEQPWDAFIDYKGGGWGIGRTPLVAAMRAFVHLKFGDEVELP